MFGLYRQRTNQLFKGVLAGLARRFGWDVWKIRGIFLVLCLLGKLGLLAIVSYILVAYFLPYQEDVMAARYGTGPRRIKEAEKIYK